MGYLFLWTFKYVGEPFNFNVLRYSLILKFSILAIFNDKIMKQSVTVEDQLPENIYTYIYMYMLPLHNFF
jgi:hypothetical protein